MAIPFLIISLLIKTTSRGPILHWSTRVGRDNKTFKMPKFRTMRLNTPNVATHLLKNVDQFITPIGKFLRKTSLDEIPQLWSVVEGNMVFVGPRPALFNQDDLITLRMEKGIHKLTPGITGWAQVKGRDELPIPEKVEMDFYYLKNRSFMLDWVIILKTIVTVLRSKGVSH
jgi:O-antigen biosynthesis protein WbqP